MLRRINHHPSSLPLTVFGGRVEFAETSGPFKRNLVGKIVLETSPQNLRSGREVLCGVE
jgi:hypothetical protein